MPNDTPVTPPANGHWAPRLVPVAMQALAIVVAVTLVHFFRWWGLAVFVPIGFSIGYFERPLQRRLAARRSSRGA